MQDPTSGATALMPNPSSATSVTFAKPSWCAMESPTRSRRQLRARKARRVLMVESDEDQRSALRAELAQAGFQVTVALDDVSAAWSLEFCHYDAVILDLGAPGSQMLEVLAQAGQTRALPSVVILTGGDEYQQNLASTLGVDLVLQKPCTAGDLSAALDHLLVG